MANFTQVNRAVCAVGRITPSGVQLLGTTFLLQKPGHFATAAHVTGQDEANLVIAFKEFTDITEFQDTSDHELKYIPAKIIATDPVHDLCILGTQSDAISTIYIGRVESVNVGENVTIFGFPHADHGRMVLTQQNTEIGARVLIQAAGVKSKHVVLNIQSRPGQSGSPIFDLKDGSVAAVLIGSYTLGGGGGISLGGIDPSTLHQTTHAISAEYLKRMF